MFCLHVKLVVHVPSSPTQGKGGARPHSPRTHRSTHTLYTTKYTLHTTHYTLYNTQYTIPTLYTLNRGESTQPWNMWTPLTGAPQPQLPAHTGNITYSQDIVSVLGQDEGYKVKYNPCLKEFQRAKAKGAPVGNGLYLTIFLK